MGYNLKKCKKWKNVLSWSRISKWSSLSSIALKNKIGDGLNFLKMKKVCIKDVVRDQDLAV